MEKKCKAVRGGGKTQHLRWPNEQCDTGGEGGVFRSEEKSGKKPNLRQGEEEIPVLSIGNLGEKINTAGTQGPRKIDETHSAPVQRGGKKRNEVLSKY